MSLRQIDDLIGQIVVVGFFVIAGATPLLIIVLTVLNAVRNHAQRMAIVVKGLTALAIWGFLTSVVVMLFMIIVFSVTSSSPMTELEVTLGSAVGCLIYLLVGGVLVNWMKRQGRPPLKSGVS